MVFWVLLLFCIIVETLKCFSNMYIEILVIYIMMFWSWNYSEYEKQEEHKKYINLYLVFH